jgi:NADH-quinone oxidoreductase subunit N
MGAIQPLQTPEIVLGPVLPEIVLVGVAILIMLLGAAGRPGHGVLGLLSFAGLLAAAAMALRLWGWPVDDPTVLGDMVATDRFAVFLRLVILGAAAVALLLSSHYLPRTGEGEAEYYALLLFATAGMTLLVSSADLILVFLSLEILSLSLYVMAGYMTRRLEAQEAGMKYFLLGAFASAFFLYGIAMAYGATGTTNLAGIAEALSGAESLGLGLGAAALLMVGLAFKVSAVPFHMWTPDVYQGAPTPVTAFMSAGTKVAGFGALLRVLSTGLGPLSWELTPALWTLAAVTMVVGSVLAIAQTDIKRMLAYSSISHAGFVLVGVVAANQEGISGALFYLAAYAAMVVGAFGVVLLVSRRGEEHTDLRSYAGLARRSPLLAGLLALFLLSLAGLPPTAGFVAKVLVFRAGILAGHWALVLVGVVATVVAAFFYIRVIVFAYMQEPERAERIPTPALPGLAVGVPAVLTLLLGVLPFLLTGVLETAGILRF